MTDCKVRPLSEDECYEAWLDAQARFSRKSPCWRCRTGARLRLRRSDLCEDEPTPAEITRYINRLPTRQREHDLDLDSV